MAKIFDDQQLTFHTVHIKVNSFVMYGVNMHIYIHVVANDIGPFHNWEKRMR